MHTQLCKYIRTGVRITKKMLQKYVYYNLFTTSCKQCSKSTTKTITYDKNGPLFSLRLFKEENREVKHTEEEK